MMDSEAHPARTCSYSGSNQPLWLARVAGVLGLAMGVGTAMAGDPQAVGKAKVDFAREIRPILAEHCWSCHGPDEAARKGKLRLDQRDAAIARKVIVPGDSDASTLIDRIESDDDTLRMPPRKAKKDLDDRQKKLLRDWIAQGAEYSQHWAYLSPRRPELPPVRNAKAVKNDIDRFILDRIEHEGLEPAPEADRLVLLRRVTLDLTGLPPTLEEQDAFLADSAPDAYERVVDRLLASPRYAERMAMAWLDAARYADTNGYNNDEDRSMWPWRDWVIHAFERNQPYDQFITEQLAGDLLPNPSLAQRVASGFHRNQGHNTEGGIIPEEYRVEYVADRVHATATVFLGLSMQCARCHDHKFDPISQREYYRFYGFFNSLDEKQGSYLGSVAVEPYVKVPSTEQAFRLADLDTKQSDLKLRIAQRELVADTALADWEKNASPDLLARYKSLGPLLHLPFDETSGESVKDESNPTRPGIIRGHPSWTAGKIGGAIALADQTYVDLGDRGATDGTSSFSVSVWVRPDSSDGMAVLSKMDEEAGYRGYDLLWEGGKLVCHLVHHWPDNALKVITKETFTPKVWRHVLVTYDGSRKPAGLKIYVDGTLRPVDVASDNLTMTIATVKPFHLGLRQKSLPFRGSIDDLQWFGDVLTAEDATHLASGKSRSPSADLWAIPTSKRTPEQRAQLRRFFLDRIDTESSRLKTELTENLHRKEEIEKTLPIAMVMQDLPKPRETFVLKRGQYDQPGERVDPDVPGSLPPLPEGAPRNRLGLARWIVDPAHPLTARVAMNRLWQMDFGTGLVKTAEDFGAMGEPPSHPELLDYLATEFVRTGWNVKAMQRLILTSATYRQSSRVARELLDRDPENRLLARGARSRLPAETVRDNALAISGLLKDQIGGPSVKPYQPEGLWEDVSVERRAKYVPDRGDGLYRRSMYTFWKRTCPPPAMTSFDATNREVCVIRRGRTNTPLQALILMNDPTYLEAARKLAERVVRTEKTTEDRLQLAFRLAATRPPRHDERPVLLEVYRVALERFRNDKGAAERLLSIGDSPRNSTAEAAELAAWTVTCSTLLNMDEVISKR
ncbi:MAG: Planctomycete cytochrome [Planctomycetota bacterium]|nr:Planctomycete cytochrome [Planctomycetota bacterium]